MPTRKRAALEARASADNARVARGEVTVYDLGAEAVRVMVSVQISWTPHGALDVTSALNRVEGFLRDLDQTGITWTATVEDQPFSKAEDLRPALRTALASP